LAFASRTVYSVYRFNEKFFLSLIPEVFTIEAKINLSKIPDAKKLKVIAFANGQSDVKFSLLLYSTLD
jgi:hypothetical protein